MRPDSPNANSPTPEWAKKGVTIVRVPGDKQRYEFADYQKYLEFMDELEERRGSLVGVNVARRA